MNKRTLLLTPALAFAVLASLWLRSSAAAQLPLRLDPPSQSETPVVSLPTQPPAPNPEHVTFVLQYQGVTAPGGMMRALANLQATGRVSAIDASSVPGRVFVLGEERAVLALRGLPGVVAITQADEAQPADDPTAPEDAQRPRLPDEPTTQPLDYGPASISANGAITGVVTADDGGAALVGVSVCAYLPSPYEYRCAYTNASGVYSISVQAGSNYRVWFTPYDYHVLEYYHNVPYNNWSGYTPVVVTDGVVTPNIDEGLAPGAQIIGRVTDATTSNPLPDIAVYAQDEASGYYAYGTTGADGIYTTTPGLPAGSYRVQFNDYNGVYATEYYTHAFRPGLATWVSVTSTNRTGIDAALRRAAFITGTVTGTGPLSNIYVEADYADEYVSTQYAYTDISGTYRLAGLGPVPYKLWFSDSSGNYVGEWYNDKSSWDNADPAALTSGITTTINVQLAQAGVISGTVTAEVGGALLNNVSVTAYDAASGNSKGSNTTNASGVYRINGLAAGNYKLRFTDNTGLYLREYYNNKPDFASADPVAVTGGVTTTINAQLVQGGVFSGTVTAEGSGTPLSNVNVRAYDAATGSSVSSNTTNASGVYRIGGLAAGSYKLRFTDNTGLYLQEYYNDKPDLASANPVAVTNGVTTTINAALAFGGHITGRVTSASSGSGIVGVSVNATRQDGSTTSGSATTDADGYYTTTALYTGVYQVSFDPPPPYWSETYNNFRPGYGFTAVTVTLGLTTTNINAALRTGYLISGTVTGSGPLEDVYVTAYRGDDDYEIDYAYTGSDGTYRIGPLAPGQYRVYFGSQDMHASLWYSNSARFAGATAINLTGDAPNINAELPIGSALTGTVAGPGGSPLAGAYIYVYPAGGGMSVAYGSTDAHGQYAITPWLAPGPYQVWFSAPTGYVSEWYANKSLQTAATIITATGGVTLTNINAQLAAITVGPGGAITGTVTAADTGLPLSMWVYAYNSSGMTVGSVYATGGAYVLSNLPAGAYRVWFSGSSPYPSRYYNNKPNLAAADVVTVTSGVTVKNINQALKPGGIITGVLTGSGGVPGVLVTAYRVSGGYWNRTIYTGVDGTYRMNYLDEGGYRVQFTPPPPFIGEWYDNAATSSKFLTVTVALSATTPNIDAALASGSVITGVVTAADTAAPLPGASANVYSATSGSSLVYTYVDMDGFYRTPGLPPGNYQVQFGAWPWASYLSEWYDNAPSSWTALTITAPALGVVPNVNAALDRGGSISGWIYDASSGIPLGGAYVDVYNATTGSWVDSAYGNAWGYYQTNGLSAGQYKLSFYRNSYMDQWYRDVRDFDTALTVTVSAPSDTPNINVYLRPYLYTYLPLVMHNSP